MRSGNLERAEPLLLESLATLREVAAARPGDLDSEVSVADAYGWLADAERLRGDYDRAMSDRKRAAALLTTSMLAELDGWTQLTRAKVLEAG